jgi:hypothetical protein
LYLRAGSYVSSRFGDGPASQYSFSTFPQFGHIRKRHVDVLRMDGIEPISLIVVPHSGHDFAGASTLI